jgi:hypothetical protein
MDVQRSAALLCDRDVDIRAISGYDPSRGTIGVGEHRAHDTAIEEMSAPWLSSYGIGWPTFISRYDRLAGDPGSEGLELLHSQQFQQTCFPRERRHASLLGEAKHADYETQTATVGEEPVKPDPS